MTKSIQLQQGALELCVLALLAGREHYADGIASTPAAVVGMGAARIYPLMRRLTDVLDQVNGVSPPAELDGATTPRVSYKM